MEKDIRLVFELAKLARLDLRPEELNALANQLPKILEYVGQLQAVKTEIVPDVAGPMTTWRDDQTEPSGVESDILGQAPAKNGNLWKVPSIL